MPYPRGELHEIPPGKFVQQIPSRVWDETKANHVLLAVETVGHPTGGLPKSAHPTGGLPAKSAHPTGGLPKSVHPTGGLPAKPSVSAKDHPHRCRLMSSRVSKG